jgi:hypothetical protein
MSRPSHQPIDLYTGVQESAASLGNTAIIGGCSDWWTLMRSPRSFKRGEPTGQPAG